MTACHLPCNYIVGHPTIFLNKRRQGNSENFVFPPKKKMSPKVYTFGDKILISSALHSSQSAASVPSEN